MKKVLITEAYIHDDYVKLNYDIMPDGTKNNFNYTGSVCVDFVSSGEMTEDEFRRLIMLKINDIIP